jgi:hypothetical protein
MLEKLPTRQGEAAHWRNKGVFESVLQSSARETRVAISRLIITLLAINFVPAVALWRYEQYAAWFKSHQRQLNLAARLVTILSCCIAAWYYCLC